MQYVSKHIARRDKHGHYKRRLIFMIALIIILLATGYALSNTIFKKEPPKLVIKKAHPGQVVFAQTIKKPVRVLILGSDSRTKSISGSRSDAIILLQLNMDKSADLVSIVRDTYTDIDGYGKRKINSAMSLGGPELTVKTVEELSGLKIDYYIVTTFQGLSSLVKYLNGLNINIDKSVDDSYSGAHLEKGTQKVMGPQITAFARARHGVVGDDWGRADHQQDILEAIYLQERKKRTDFRSLANLIAAVLKRTETDLDLKELACLAKTVFEVKPEKVRKKVIKGNDAKIDGQWIVELNQKDIVLTFDALRQRAGE